MSIVSLLADSREPASITTLAFGGAPKTVTELAAGDLLAMCADGAVLAIERKTASDLLNTLAGGRLFPQLARLRETTPWAYLVVCGLLYCGANGRVVVEDGSALGTRESGWDWWAVQGALLTAQEIGVRIVFVPAPSPDAYEQAVLKLARRSRAALPVPPVRDTTMLSEYEAVLTALPGIGQKGAAAILAACGTPAWGLVSLTENPDLPGRKRYPSLPIAGVGPATRRAVRDALGLEEWAELAVVTVDDGITEGTAGDTDDGERDGDSGAGVAAGADERAREPAHTAAVR